VGRGTAHAGLGWHACASGSPTRVYEHKQTSVTPPRLRSRHACGHACGLSPLAQWHVHMAYGCSRVLGKRMFIRVFTSCPQGPCDPYEHVPTLSLPVARHAKRGLILVKPTLNSFQGLFWAEATDLAGFGQSG
jgi:hypothetical protein